jgi:Lar family restriction alleviation protein
MTEQKQVQLLPCPFCGGDAKYEAEGEWQYYDVWSVECQVCGASVCGNADMRVSGASAKAEAIAAWNTRHTATSEALEAMRVMAEHPRWELSCDCWDTGDWQVYSVDGPRSDREWHLIGSGDTPLAALTAAIAKIEGEQP